MRNLENSRTTDPAGVGSGAARTRHGAGRLRRAWCGLVAAGLRTALFFLPGLLVGLPVAAETFEVKVFDYFFEPFQLSIRTGDTIEWVAYGFGHTVRSDSALFDSSQVWGSSIPALQSYKFTFHEPGFYPYYSVEYGGPEGVGMSATVNVTGPVTNQIPTVPTNALPVMGSLLPLTIVGLQGSRFVDGDEGDRHLASQWIVRRVSDGVLIYDTGEVGDDGGISGSRTNWFLPGQRLEYATEYAWRVRYRDSYGAWSPYSAATTFRTAPPALTAALHPGEIVVTWPSNSAGFTLEYSTNSLLETWFPVGATPQPMNGGVGITNAVTDRWRVYRLRKGS